MDHTTGQAEMVASHQASHGLYSTTSVEVGSLVGLGGARGSFHSLAGQSGVAGSSPSGGGAAAAAVTVQDAEGWWRAAQQVLQELVRKTDEEARGTVWTPLCVSLSGQMQNVVQLGAAATGTTANWAVLYSDTALGADADSRMRQDGTAAWLGAQTGNYKGAASVAAKLRALSGAKMTTTTTPLVFGAHSYVAYRLAGNIASAAACDPTTASTVGLVSLTTGRWLEEHDLRNRARIGGFAFPTLLDRADATVGHVQSGEGIPRQLWECPIIHGAGDAGSTALGAACLFPESRAHAYVGTSGWVAAIVPRGSVPPNVAFQLAHPVLKTHVLVAAPTTSAGENVSVWSRILGLSLAHFDSAAHAAMAQRGAGPAPLYIPHLRGERFPTLIPHGRGALVDVGPEATSGDVASAVLHGVAAQYRVMAEALGAAGALPREEPLVVVGGGAKSRVWLQIMSNVMGRTVVRSADTAVDAAVLGAAVLGCGRGMSLRRGVDAFVPAATARSVDQQAYDQQWAKAVAAVHSRL